MGEVCRTTGGQRNAHGLVGKPKEKSSLWGQSHRWENNSKFSIKEMASVIVDWIYFVLDGICDHGNKPSFSIYFGESCDQQRNWVLLTKDSLPWISLVVMSGIQNGKSHVTNVTLQPSNTEPLYAPTEHRDPSEVINVFVRWYSEMLI
jgi:hypothetical protein